MLWISCHLSDAQSAVQWKAQSTAAVIIVFLIKVSAGLGREISTWSEYIWIFGHRALELGKVNSLLCPHFLHWKLTEISLLAIQFWEQSELVNAQVSDIWRNVPQIKLLYRFSLFKATFIVFFPIGKQGKGSFENYIIASLISNSQMESNRLHIWISNSVPLTPFINHLVTKAVLESWKYLFSHQISLEWWDFSLLG